jgi:cytochrome c biogenesis protein CcmG/thiol:disulfide interchange protein DsbE
MDELTKPEGSSAPNKLLPLWVAILAVVLLLGFLWFLARSMKQVDIQPVKVGSLAPNFTLNSFSGEKYEISGLRGKVILINFWASWCLTCKEEAQILEEVWQEVQPTGAVIFLGVDYVDTEREALAYLDEFGITYPNGPDLRTEISQLFRLTGVPETYLIDQEGRLVDLRIGPFTSADEIREMLRKYMD